ncbi:unnamed protein product [Owenia fusiformis]|uniref:Uncharacterized protein n=1 Tax=Owenia fusiformis TaxID=6347 RepID=A0A8S4P6Q1_OWEFU|nr:unnamed protein product [Owenia fusiformis]
MKLRVMTFMLLAAAVNGAIVRPNTLREKRMTEQNGGSNECFSCSSWWEGVCMKGAIRDEVRPWVASESCPSGRCFIRRQFETNMPVYYRGCADHFPGLDMFTEEGCVSGSFTPYGWVDQWCFCNGGFCNGQSFKDLGGTELDDMYDYVDTENDVNDVDQDQIDMQGQGNMQGQGDMNGQGDMEGQGNMQGQGDMNGQGDMEGQGNMQGQGDMNGQGDMEGQGNMQGQGDMNGQGDMQGQGDMKEQGDMHNQGDTHSMQDGDHNNNDGTIGDVTDGTMATAMIDNNVDTTTVLDANLTKTGGADHVFCYDCSSWWDVCRRFGIADDHKSIVSKTECSSKKCFIREDKDGAVYRGCADGWPALADYTNSGCVNGTDVGSPWTTQWCFCDSDECNGIDYADIQGTGAAELTSTPRPSTSGP